MIPLGTVYCKKCKPNPHSNVEPRIISGAARRSTRGAHDAAHPAVSTDGRRRRTLTVHRDPAVPRPPTAPRRNSELDFQISRLHNPVAARCRRSDASVSEYVRLELVVCGCVVNSAGTLVAPPCWSIRTPCRAVRDAAALRPRLPVQLQTPSVQDPPRGTYGNKVELPAAPTCQLNTATHRGTRHTCWGVSLLLIHRWQRERAEADVTPLRQVVQLSTRKRGLREAEDELLLLLLLLLLLSHPFSMSRMTR